MFCRLVFDFPVGIFAGVAEVGTVVATWLGQALDTDHDKKGNDGKELEW
jgi:hypothetical protein